MSRSSSLPVATHAVYIRYGALLREQALLCWYMVTWILKVKF